MRYDFDEIIDRHGTFSMKWDYPELQKHIGTAERFDDQTIPVFVADMDFRCAEPIRQALMKVAEHNIYGYSAVIPEGVGNEYFDAVRGWFSRRHGWEFSADDIIYVNGTVEAIRKAIQAFTEPGDGVLMDLPIYYPFMTAAEDSGRRVVNSQLVNDGEGYYTFDFEDLEKKASDPSVKIFLLCSPHNPTGRIWTDEELKTIADICRRNGVIIVADEIHGDLIRRGEDFHPIAQVCGPEGIITCTAINKTFNTAGLQATNVVIIDEELRRRFIEAVGHCMPNPFTIAAVIAAYNEGEEWLEQLIDYIDGNIDLVISYMKEHLPQVKIWRPQGTYIMWMDFRALGLSAEEIRRRIYVDANVMLEAGSVFDPENGAGFERICVPCPRAVLAEALRRIAAQF